jgi:hypothetical protein
MSHLEAQCRQDLEAIELLLTVNHEGTKGLEEELEYLKWVSECAAQAVDDAEDSLAAHRREVSKLQMRRARLVISMKQCGWTI